MRKIELLVPASSLEVLKIAVIFGADLQHLKTASRNQQFYFSHIVHSCFTLTVTPSPNGMIEVIRDGLCFSSYRYSRILLYMVLFLRSTR